MRAPNPRTRAASASKIAKSRHDPHPRNRVSFGDWVPSISRLSYEMWADTPLLMSFRRDSVSVGRLQTKPLTHWENRPCLSPYCGAVSAPRSVHSSSEWRNGYSIAEAEMGKTGQAGAVSSRRARLSITRRSVRETNIAVAMALPAMSCAHVTVASGVTDTRCEISRRSRVSRGRSISLCGPRDTSCRYL